MESSQKAKVTWILQYEDGGFAGIDLSSGGYPYNCGPDLGPAKFWDEDHKLDLQRYMEMFPYLKLFEFKYELQPTKL